MYWRINKNVSLTKILSKINEEIINEIDRNDLEFINKSYKYWLNDKIEKTCNTKEKEILKSEIIQPTRALFRLFLEEAEYKLNVYPNLYPIYLKIYDDENFYYIENQLLINKQLKILNDKFSNYNFEKIEDIPAILNFYFSIKLVDFQDILKLIFNK